MSTDQTQVQLLAERKDYVSKIKGQSPDWDMVQRFARMLSDAVDAPNGFVPLCEGAMVRLARFLREEHEKELQSATKMVRRSERAIIRAAVEKALG